MEALLSWAAQAAPPQLAGAPTSLDDLIGPYAPLRFRARPEERRNDSLTLRQLDDLVVLDVEWDAGSASSRQAARDTDHLVLMLVRTGADVVDEGGRRHRLEPGTLALWDPRAPVDIGMPAPSRKSGFLVPRSVLRKPGRQGGPGFDVLDPRCLAAQLLKQTIVGLDPGRFESTGERHLRNALVELLHSALSARTSTVRADQALCMAIEVWLDDHLYEADLGVSTVAAAHSVSVRTAQRAFAQSGTAVSELVRKKKLERARTLLLGTDLSVTNVSERLHFSSPSHFTRAFSAEYGVTPSGIRSVPRVVTRPAAQ